MWRPPDGTPRGDRETIRPPELGVQGIRKTVQHIGVIGETEFLDQPLSRQGLFLRVFVFAQP